MSDCAVVQQYTPETFIRYQPGHPWEFMPWLRTESLETHILINDLVHDLEVGRTPTHEPVRQRLEALRAEHRVAVDQYSADGTLMATYAKHLALRETWRLSLERAERHVLEYGLLVLRGPDTICHFQIVGPRTFATCHARRYPLDQAPRPYRRWIPFPQPTDSLLTLLLINCGRETNRIVLSPVVLGQRQEGVEVCLPHLGCRMVCLSQIFKSRAQEERIERVSIEAASPCDFYTLLENGLASAETFSIQHVK